MDVVRYASDLDKSISAVRGSECSEVMKSSIALQAAWLAPAWIKTFVKECKGWFSRCSGSICASLLSISKMSKSTAIWAASITKVAAV